MSNVALHAWVLMDNHFHLLATPRTVDGLPLAMQAIGRSYVAYFNRRHARSGALWQGRYRSTVIESDRYLLACMAYIDLNPVRAGLVAAAADWLWSSHRHYIGARHDPHIEPHPLVWDLGNTPFSREARYAELIAGGLAPGVPEAITRATLAGWAMGDDAFLKDLQAHTDRRTQPLGAGRPLNALGTTEATRKPH